MRTQKFFAPFLIIIALIAFMILDGFYTVGEQEQAVITMFGNVVRTDTAGLYCGHDDTRNRNRLRDR